MVRGSPAPTGTTPRQNSCSATREGLPIVRLPGGWGHFLENSVHFRASILFISKMMGKLGDSISEIRDINLGPHYYHSNRMQSLA